LEVNGKIILPYSSTDPQKLLPCLSTRNDGDITFAHKLSYFVASDRKKIVSDAPGTESI
jgi:hypothetical protein